MSTLRLVLALYFGLLGVFALGLVLRSTLRHSVASKPWGRTVVLTVGVMSITGAFCAFRGFPIGWFAALAATAIPFASDIYTLARFTRAVATSAKPKTVPFGNLLRLLEREEAIRTWQSQVADVLWNGAVLVLLLSAFGRQVFGL